MSLLDEMVHTPPPSPQRLHHRRISPPPQYSQIRNELRRRNRRATVVPQTGRRHHRRAAARRRISTVFDGFLSLFKDFNFNYWCSFLVIQKDVRCCVTTYNIAAGKLFLVIILATLLAYMFF